MTLPQIIISESILRLKENHQKIIVCLTNLDDQSIWWKPHTSSNSIGNILIHLCGNLTQYVLSGIGGLPDHRQRQEEFTFNTPLSKETVLTKLEQTLDAVYAVIEKCTEVDLITIRGVQCYQMSGAAILIHITEHMSYHTGQIVYFVKSKTGKAMNFYDDKKLEGTAGGIVAE